MPNSLQIITEAENIEGLGTILRCDAPFDQALQTLGGKDIITASQLVYARIKVGSEHSLSQNGSYIKEGSLFVPNSARKRILLRGSLVLQNPAAATEAHRQNQEYFPSDFLDAKEVEAYLEQLPAGSYLTISDLSRVPVGRFGEDERTVWLFGEHARNYGLFLKDAKVESTGFFLHTGNDQYIDTQTKPFANQLWLFGIGYDSGVSGNNWGLGCGNRVRLVAQNFFPQEIVQQQQNKSNIPSEPAQKPQIDGRELTAKEIVILRALRNGAKTIDDYVKLSQAEKELLDAARKYELTPAAIQKIQAGEPFDSATHNYYAVKKGTPEAQGSDNRFRKIELD